MKMQNEKPALDLFSYRGKAGFQSHSRTSRMAAEEGKPSFSRQAAIVLGYIASRGRTGAITDEIRRALLADKKIHENSVMSARVRELEMAGMIVKTTEERRTTANQAANVYVTSEIFAQGGFLRDCAKPAPEPKQRGYKAKWFKYDEWHEDYGTALWHFLPVSEPCYSGTPLDSDWPYEYTDKSTLRWCYPPAPPVK